MSRLTLLLLVALLGLAGCDSQIGGAAAPGPPPGAAPPINWSTVTPAPEREARLALYGIIRRIDLTRDEHTGWDILSYEPGAGPTDRYYNTYSPVPVAGDTVEVTPEHWLAIFEMVEAYRADGEEYFMIRPVSDDRYADGETSRRGNLVFAIVVEDSAEKTLKFVWTPQ